MALAQEVGHVIGTEGAGRKSFLESLDLFGAASARQTEEFAKLAGEQAAGIGQTPQISLYPQAA